MEIGLARAWMDTLPVPAWLFRVAGPEFLLVDVSTPVRTAHPEILGLIGHPIGRLYRDQPEILADAATCMRERRTIVRETHIRRYDRARRDQHLRLTFACLSPELLVLYADDLSPVSSATAALEESETRYRSLLASLPDGVVVYSPTGHVLAANEAAARWFGHRDAAATLGRLGLSGAGVVVRNAGGAYVAGNQNIAARVLETGQPVLNEELRLDYPDGTRRWLRAAAQPIQPPGGPLYGVVATFTDETARIDAMHEAEVAATRLSAALSAARMGAWEWIAGEDDGRWSVDVEALFHVQVPRSGLRAFLKIVDPRDHERLRSEARSFLAHLPTVDAFETDLRILGDDGRTRWARFTGRLLRGDRGLHLIGTAMDITERRRLEEAVAQSSRLEALGRLAGGIAHDFNNFTHAILNATDELGEDLPERVHAEVATIRDAANRARDLVNQLLGFARQQRADPRPLSLGDLLSRQERVLSRLAGPHHSLVLERGAPAWALADEVQMSQVLMNLVANARDAMPDGGQIVLRTDAIDATTDAESPIGEWALVQLEDTGVGMDAETLAHAFDPFYTTKPHGTGLGLASCYGIVQQAGGHIRVTSQPGRGTCFRIYLPRVAPTAGPEPAAPTRTGPNVSTILLVDDDPLVRASLARTLAGLGYHVLVAADGTGAIAHARSYEGRIDLLLTDVAMPGLSGPEVADAVRILRPGIRVVYASGYADDVGPADAILHKPFSRSDLGAVLRRLTLHL